LIDLLILTVSKKVLIHWASILNRMRRDSCMPWDSVASQWLVHFMTFNYWL